MRGAGDLQALEAAVVAHPDEPALHAALADYLTEHGDPRGDFIRLQLALEELPPHDPQAATLRQQEIALLHSHAAAWLGAPLAAHVLDRPNVRFIFTRGWLDSLIVPTTREDLSRCLAESPAARLLRMWVVADVAGKEPFNRHEAFANEVLAGSAVYYPDEAVALDPLADSDNLRNLRTLQLGDPEFALADFGDQALYSFLTHLPRLETLILSYYLLDTRRLFAIDMPSLRRLHVTGVFSYFLEVLGLNGSLAGLTHLQLEPAGPGGHQKLMTADVLRLVRSPHLKGLRHLQLRFCALGDVVCEDLVASGILARLKTLDLQFSDITDNGAERLATCPDFRKLESLDVSCNRLTERGLNRLRSTGVSVIGTHQYAVGEAD